MDYDEDLRKALEWSELESAQAEDDDMQRAIELSLRKGVTENSNTKILVYCHPRDPKLADNPHWYTNIMKTEAPGYDAADVYWVDPAADDANPNAFREDGFSEAFVSRFENTFDHVFAPDCGGAWYNRPEDHADMVVSISRVLKPGGTMVVSKFFDDRSTPKIVAGKLNTGSNGLTAEVFAIPHVHSAHTLKLMKVIDDMDSGRIPKDGKYDMITKMIESARRDTSVGNPTIGTTNLRVTKEVGQRGGARKYGFAIACAVVTLVASFAQCA